MQFTSYGCIAIAAKFILIRIVLHVLTLLLDSVGRIRGVNIDLYHDCLSAKIVVTWTAHFVVKYFFFFFSILWLWTFDL